MCRNVLIFNTNKVQKTCDLRQLTTWLITRNIYTVFIWNKLVMNLYQIYNWEINQLLDQCPEHGTASHEIPSSSDQMQSAGTVRSYSTWFPGVVLSLQSSWSTPAERCGCLSHRKSETWSCRGIAHRTSTLSGLCLAWWLLGPGWGNVWHCQCSGRGTRTPDAAQRGQMSVYFVYILWRSCLCAAGHT